MKNLTNFIDDKFKFKLRPESKEHRYNSDYEYIVNWVLFEATEEELEIFYPDPEKRLIQPNQYVAIKRAIKPKEKFFLANNIYVLPIVIAPCETSCLYEIFDLDLCPLPEDKIIRDLIDSAFEKDPFLKIYSKF